MSKKTERVSMEINGFERCIAQGTPRFPSDSDQYYLSGLLSDLRHAKVHFVPMGGLGDVDTIMAGLEEIGGFINREVAKKIKMKYSPKLRFYPDEHFFENVDFIDQLDNMTFVDVESEEESDT